jgi:hypothetical protein
LQTHRPAWETGATRHHHRWNRPSVIHPKRCVQL